MMKKANTRLHVHLQLGREPNTILNLRTKDRYRELCRRGAPIPVQAQAFWWDVTCGENGWDVVLIVNDQEEVLAAWPYRIERKYGLRILRAAPLATYGYIYLRCSPSSRVYKQQALEQHLSNLLLQKLPAFDLAHLNLHPAHAEIAAFRRAGARCYFSTTYVFDALTDVSYIHARMAPSVRNHLRKARKAGLRVAIGDDIGEFQILLEQTFLRKQLPTPQAIDTLNVLHASIQKKGAGCLLGVFDSGGKMQAGALLAWDSGCLHFLLSGQSESGRQKRAMYLLIWEAVKLAARKQLMFDFDGSMLPEIEPVFRAFGAKRQAYMELIWSRTFRAKVALCLKELLFKAG